MGGLLAEASRTGRGGVQGGEGVGSVLMVRSRRGHGGQWRGVAVPLLVRSARGGVESEDGEGEEVVGVDYG